MKDDGCYGEKVEDEEDRVSQAGQGGVAVLSTVVRKSSPTKLTTESRREGMKERAMWSSRVEGAASKARVCLSGWEISKEMGVARVQESKVEKSRR